MKKINKNTKIFTLVFMLLLIGLGYAYLNASIKFNGTTHIGAGSWNLKFSNANVTNVSTTTTFPSNSNSNKPTLISGIGTHEIDYEVIFNQPGDYYEFTFDIVNRGDIDSELLNHEIKNKIGSATEYQSSFPNYISSNISVDDSKKNWNAVAHGTTVTAKIKFELCSDVTEEELANIQGKVISIKDIYEYSVSHQYAS